MNLGRSGVSRRARGPDRVEVLRTRPGHRPGPTAAGPPAAARRPCCAPSPDSSPPTTVRSSSTASRSPSVGESPKRGVTSSRRRARFSAPRRRRDIAFGLSRKASKTRVDELLDLVGMSGMGSRRPHEISGGQQQRVALARALAPEPKLVLLDEPFSALDAGLRESVRAQVRRALRLAGTTALLVTHDQDEALSVADSVAVLADGRVAMHDSPERVYAAPTDLGVARFVGQVVELPGRALGDQAHTASVP